jgi:outer membrane protein assembly factor BamB
MARGKISILKLLFFPLFCVFCFLPGLQAQDTPIIDAPSWRQALGGAIISQPVAQVESVVLATDGGNLRSYSSQGNLLWDYFARGRLTPHISRSREGTSYICRINGILIAINRSGRELWQINLRSPIVFPVLTGWDGRLFVFAERRIICLTAAGYILWSRDLYSKTLINPVRDKAGGVILLQEDGEVLRFDAFGNVFSYRSESGAMPVTAASVEIEGRGTAILLLYENRNLELVFPSEGFAESIGSRLILPSAPLAAIGRNNEAAVLLRDGRLALISMGSMETIWLGATHTGAAELPADPDAVRLIFDERGIYLTTLNGATGFTQDGRRLWTIRLRGAASLPTFGDDGILYSGGADWILYAYHMEDRVRASNRLIYGELPEGTYGTGNPGPSSWADYFFRYEERELEERFTEIRRAIINGAVGAAEKEYTAWLMEIAASYIMSPRPVLQPPIHVHRRAEATRLLAYIGSRETIPFLTMLFTHDPETHVKSAAAEAIGIIGVDPEGIALTAFENAVLPPLPLMDEMVLTAVATAIGALCRFSGPPLSNTGIRLLTILSGYDRFPLVRNRAQRELMSLRI